MTDCLPRRCGICLYRKQGDQSRGKFESNRMVWKNLGPWRSLIAYTCKASTMVWDPLIVLFLLLMWLIKLFLLLFKEGIVTGINGHLTLIINYVMECLFYKLDFNKIKFCVKFGIIKIEFYVYFILTLDKICIELNIVNFFFLIFGKPTLLMLSSTYMHRIWHC